MNAILRFCTQYQDIFSTIGNIASFIGIIGIIFAYTEWRRKRANILEGIINKIGNDKDITEFFYKIDYGRKWYKKRFHNGGELEKQTDRAISYFTYLAYLTNSRILSKREQKFVSYQLNRILANIQVCDYLYNLKHFTKNKSPFYELEKYAKKHNYLDDEFSMKDGHLKKPQKYHKYLEW